MKVFGVDRMKDVLIMTKTITLAAWAKIMLNEGFINNERYSKMVDKIQKIKR